MKKGFTLIELLATIIILSAIILIIAPLIIGQINKGRELVETQSKDNAALSAKNWANENKYLLPEDGEVGTIYISQLQKFGFLEDDVTTVDKNDCVVISNHNGAYYYNYHKNTDDICKENSIYKVVTLDAKTNGGKINGQDNVTIIGYPGQEIKIENAVSNNNKYNFMGWATTSEEKNNLYKDTYKIPKTDITLYAVYMRPSETYTLSFNANGGSGSVPSRQCSTKTLYNTDYSTPSCTVYLPNNSFTRSGYAFNGWSSNKNASSGALVNNPVTLTKSMTYYAIWKSLKPSCTITSSGGTTKTINGNPWYYKGTPKITLTTTNTSSYTFYGPDEKRLYSKTDTLDYDVERGIYQATVRSASGYSSTCSLTISRDTTAPKLYIAFCDENSYTGDIDQWGVKHYGEYINATNENIVGGTYSSSSLMYRVATVDFINPYASFPTGAEGTGGYGSGLVLPVKVYVNNVLTNTYSPGHYDRVTTHRNYLGSYRIDSYQRITGSGKKTVKFVSSDALGNTRTLTMTATAR